MGFKENAVIGATVIGLLIGADRMLAPQTSEDLKQQIQEQRVEDLADSKENQNDRRRDQLPDDIDAENREKLRPGERRPPELPKLRLRIP